MQFETTESRRKEDNRLDRPKAALNHVRNATEARAQGLIDKPTKNSKAKSNIIYYG